MAKPIPLFCKDNAGTGFLVTDGAAMWLVTCIHIITGVGKTSPDLSHFQNAQIRIAETNFALAPIVNGLQRFSVVINETDGNLVDVIAIKLTAAEAASLQGYEAFDVSQIAPAKKGDNLSAKGFPGLGGILSLGKTVPPPTTLQATVSQVEGVSIALDKASAQGLSGGPVLRGKYLIGVMQGDLGHLWKMESAHIISLDVVGGQLFK